MKVLVVLSLAALVLALAVPTAQAAEPDEVLFAQAWTKFTSWLLGTWDSMAAHLEASDAIPDELDMGDPDIPMVQPDTGDPDIPMVVPNRL